MAEITYTQSGEFIPIIVKLLWDKPEGMQIKKILAHIPTVTELSEYEAGYYPSAPNKQRYEKIARFATIGAVKAVWLIKKKGYWFLTDEGKQTDEQFSDPEEFYREADRLYHIWKKSRVTKRHCNRK